MNTRFLTFDNYGRAEQAKSANLLRRIENNINQFHDDKLVYDFMKGGSHKDKLLKYYLQDFKNAFDIFRNAVLNPDRKKRPDDDDFRRAKESLKDEF